MIWCGLTTKKNYHHKKRSKLLSRKKKKSKWKNLHNIKVLPAKIICLQKLLSKKCLWQNLPTKKNNTLKNISRKKILKLKFPLRKIGIFKNTNHKNAFLKLNKNNSWTQHNAYYTRQQLIFRCFSNFLRYFKPIE